MNWKDDEDKVSKELVDARDRLVDHLTTTCGLLTLAIGVVMAKEESSANQPDTQVIKPLLHSLYASTRSLRQLSKPLGMQIRDCYPIARGLSETIVNVMLIMAKGNGPAEQMLAHARQRTFRDHYRTTVVAGVTITTKYTGIDPSNPPPQIAADLQRFTSKKGRAMSWTDLSVAQRIDAIAQTYPQRKFIGLAQTVHWLYPVASDLPPGFRTTE